MTTTATYALLGFALALLADRAVVFAYRRATRPVPRIEDHR